MLYYIKCKDGRRWKVRQATSLKAACNTIAHARVTGSVGAKDMATNAVIGRPIAEWPSIVMADVVQVNSDNSERKPYTEAY